MTTMCLINLSMGWVPGLGFTISHGKQFQKHRSLIQQAFTPQKIKEYSHIQTKEAHRLALHLLERPNDSEAMLSRSVTSHVSPSGTEYKLNEVSIFFSFSTAIIMQVTFGHEIVSDNDPYLELAWESGYAVTHCGPIGNTPVDLFPVRKCTQNHCSHDVGLKQSTVEYLPSWFPGTHFAQKAREFRSCVRRLHDFPFSEVQRQMVGMYLVFVISCKT